MSRKRVAVVAKYGVRRVELHLRDPATGNGVTLVLSDGTASLLSMLARPQPYDPLHPAPAVGPVDITCTMEVCLGQGSQKTEP